MDVNTTRVLDPLVSYSPNGNSGTGQADGTASAAGQNDVPATAVTAAPDTDKSAKPGKQVSRDSLQTMAAEMNKFMELLNTDIQFKVHERTHELMVRVVSEKDQQVLREYPSHEFLDMIANIRDYVGMLLDKRA